MRAYAMSQPYSKMYDLHCSYCKIVTSDPHEQIIKRWYDCMAFTSSTDNSQIILVPNFHIRDATVSLTTAADVFRHAVEYVAQHRLEANITTAVGYNAGQREDHFSVHIIPATTSKH